MLETGQPEMERAMSPSRLMSCIAVAVGLPVAAQAEGLALRYEVYAGGSLAVAMEAELAIEAGGYRLGTGMELAGLYALVSSWDMQASVSGLVDSGRVLPFSFTKLSEGGERWATLTFSDGVMTQARGNPPPENEDTSTVPAAIKAAALDPLSGAVTVLHRLAQTGQCGGVMHIYDGKTYFTVTSIDQGDGAAPDTDYGAYSGPARLCAVTVDDSAAYGRTDSDPRDALLWLARPLPHAPYVPVRIETQSRFGAVRVHLVDYWPVAGETAQSQ